MKRAYRKDRSAKPPSEVDLKRWRRFLDACRAVGESPLDEAVARSLVDARNAVKSRPMPRGEYAEGYASPLYRAWLRSAGWGSLSAAMRCESAPELARLAGLVKLDGASPLIPAPTHAVRHRADLDG